MNSLIFIIIGIIIGTVISKNNTHSDKNTTYSKDIPTIIKVLSRQSARWAIAAQQDKSPIVGSLHANYGTGYLWALRDVATDDEIKEHAGIDISKFQKKIVGIQDMSTKNVSSACPQFVGDIDKYLLEIGGDA